MRIYAERIKRVLNVGLVVHDADYRQSKSDFDRFVECLTEKIVEKDETVPELPSKDLVIFSKSHPTTITLIWTLYRLSAYTAISDSVQIQHPIRSVLFFPTNHPIIQH